jgi:hypothetical protein
MFLQILYQIALYSKWWHHFFCASFRAFQWKINTITASCTVCGQLTCSPSLNIQSCIKGLLVVRDFFFGPFGPGLVWAAGPVLKKSSGPIMSSFWGYFVHVRQVRIDNLEYLKVATSILSRLLAHTSIFRLFMKGKFDAYVLWPSDKRVQNWIVDWSTARNFMVNNLGMTFNNSL